MLNVWKNVCILKIYRIHLTFILEPTQSIIFLGFNINSITMKITLTQNKQEALKFETFLFFIMYV